MAKAKKRKGQQGCDVAKLIDTIEKAASTAMKIYRAIKPIIKAIRTNGRKPNDKIQMVFSTIVA
jgi:hypothetical protein